MSPHRRFALVASVAVVAAAIPASAVTTVRTVGVVSNDIAYDSAHNKLFVTVPSSVGAGGNSLRVIDPVAGVAGASVFVGSEPTRLAISDNGQYAYVGLSGAAAVRRVDLATLTAGLQFTLGADGFFGPMYAEDIEVVPGSPQSVVVSRHYLGVSPRSAGVGIYDDGVKRSTDVPGHTSANVIEFSTGPTTLYGYNNETTEFGFRTISVTPAGLTTTNVTAGLIGNFGTDIEGGGGKIVSTNGRVIDAATHSLLGTVGGSGPLAVESDGSRAYFANSGTVQIYDLNTFLPLNSISVPGLSGPLDVVRFGADGLAVRTTSTVYLLNSPGVIPEPATLAILGTPLLVLSRRRRV